MFETELIGSFYFRRTHHGNLIGEFTNTASQAILTESCDLIPDSGNEIEFVGRYQSSWRQGNLVFQLELNISETPDLKFNLVWTGQSGNTEYQGQGFIVDGLLTGFYIQGALPNMTT